MGKRKKQKSNKEEDAKLVVRIEAGLRDAFIEACQEIDTTASREVRRFIRDFLEGDRARNPEVARLVLRLSLSVL